MKVAQPRKRSGLGIKQRDTSVPSRGDVTVARTKAPAGMRKDGAVPWDFGPRLMNNFGLPIRDDREKRRDISIVPVGTVAFFSFSRHFVPGYFHRVPPGRAPEELGAHCKNRLTAQPPNRQPPTANR